MHCAMSQHCPIGIARDHDAQSTEFGLLVDFISKIGRFSQFLLRLFCTECAYGHILCLSKLRCCQKKLTKVSVTGTGPVQAGAREAQS